MTIPDVIWVAIITALLGGGFWEAIRRIQAGQHEDDKTDAETQNLVTQVTEKVMQIAHTQLDDMEEQLTGRLADLEKCKHDLAQVMERVELLEQGRA